jgi:hypothetical protein
MTMTPHRYAAALSYCAAALKAAMPRAVKQTLQCHKNECTGLWFVL